MDPSTTVNIIIIIIILLARDFGINVWKKFYVLTKHTHSKIELTNGDISKETTFTFTFTFATITTTADKLKI